MYVVSASLCTGPAEFRISKRQILLTFDSETGTREKDKREKIRVIFDFAAGC